MKTLSASAVRQTLPDLLGAVVHEREPVLIERGGRPVAALVSVEDFNILEKVIEEESNAEWQEALKALPDLNAKLDSMATMLTREQQSVKTFREEMDRLHTQRKKLLCQL